MLYFIVEDKVPETAITLINNNILYFMEIKY